MAKKKRGPIKDPIVFAKLVLRGASRKWYAGNEVLKRCRIERGVYQCEGCLKAFKKHQIEVDHIEPVVDIKTGFTDLLEWIKRLLVPPEKLQALCCIKHPDGSKTGCHPNKTSAEAAMRKFYKDQKKVKKKQK